MSTSDHRRHAVEMQASATKVHFSLAVTLTSVHDEALYKSTFTFTLPLP